jgi:hypothetical protein
VPKLSIFGQGQSFGEAQGMTTEVRAINIYGMFVDFAKSYAFPRPRKAQLEAAYT